MLESEILLTEEKLYPLILLNFPLVEVGDNAVSPPMVNIVKPALINTDKSALINIDQCTVL